ncbi:MAG: hypothetical protein IJU23_00565 [Proteobacteria bacterium]|nr:hypothetical protein [Pseudomonadota bacterium]
MRRIVLFWMLALSAWACSPAVPQKSHDEEPAQVHEKWEEITAETVSFVRMHPGAAQKNVYAEWKHFSKTGSGEKEWRVNKEPVSDEGLALLDKLYEAVAADLIPSNGLYGCRYREGIPEYRLNFRHDGHEYSAVSASNCLHGAPWNVFVDGKSHVQVSGAIGIALEPLLHSASIEMNVGDTAGMITFSDSVQLEGYSANGDANPVAWYDAEFRKDAAFGAWLEEARKFGELGLPEIACNQANSEDCRDVSARYRVKAYSGQYELPVVLKYVSGAVEATLPPKAAMDALNSLKISPEWKFWPGVLRNWDRAAERNKDALRLTWSEPSECKMVKGLAKHFDKPETASCGMWTISLKDFPTAIYYVGLDAIWLEPGHDYKAFFDALSKYRKQSKKYEKIDYRPFVSTDKDTNLFLRASGKPIAFVTKKGQTTIKE